MLGMLFLEHVMFSVRVYVMKILLKVLHITFTTLSYIFFHFELHFLNDNKSQPVVVGI